VIAKLFEITDFIDKARWGNKENYNLINFYRHDLSSDVKILTHWICYSADRQMAFERVWDVGGFVFSEMADQITEKEDLELLNPQRREKSFFIRRDDYPDKAKYDFDDGDNGKYLFVSHQVLKDNELLLEYEYIKGTKPYFISRFYPSDYMSILSTFCILQDYDFSLTGYIIALLEKVVGKEDFIQRLLYSLYLLSYFDIGQPKSSDLMHFDRNLAKAEKRKKDVKNILNSPKIFDEEFDYFKKDIIFKQKRAWCSLRDFVKSPEFKEYFFTALKEAGFTDHSMFHSKAALQYLELPGDVWNNNPTFRKCVMQGTGYEGSKLSLSKLLRTMFNENRATIPAGYPEQFDVTFDFVLRMCDKKGNCSICPYALLHGEAKEFNKVCIAETGKYCPIMYISCNYKMTCLGKDCLLQQYANG
jgi:hypothetical protein